MSRFVDCLAHLDDARVTDVAAVLARAEAAELSDVVSAGFDPKTRRRPWASLDTKLRVWDAVGLHPRAIRPDYNRQLGMVERDLRGPRVVALGEIGLDARPGSAPLDIQRVVFQRQLDLAKRWGLPVIIHCVKATALLLDILREEGPFKAGGMVHAFSGPPDLVRTFVDLNLSLSFGALVTDESAQRCRKSALIVPKPYLLVESDTPDHPPAGGEALSEPASILKTIEVLAALRKEDPAVLGEGTAQNARRLFRLDATPEIGEEDGTTNSGS